MRRLARCPIGIVPILWNNVDLVDLAPEVPPDTVLDACARLGYEGVQFGRAFPEGDALTAELSARHLGLAEVYAELPCTPDGPSERALDIGRARLAILDGAGGDVLVAACEVGGGRSEWAGRGDDHAAPRFTDAGWAQMAEVVNVLAAETSRLGRRLAFHPHAGTYVETPGEIARFVSETDPANVGICLDVGHLTVGGGDPVSTIDELGGRIRHVHLKDVDGTVVAGLRTGSVPDFGAAIRARVFTELGNGVIDLDGIIGALERIDYAGWLMVEQDSSRLAPAEAAVVGRRVLAYALAGRPS